MIYTEAELVSMAYDATQHLLENKRITITHPNGWSRDGFPIPVERRPAAADGSVTQEYRPLALLEFIQACIRGEIPSQRKSS